MKMGSIRRLTMGLTAVGFIAACGGSNNSPGFTAKKTPDASTSSDNSSGGNSSGSSGGDNSSTPGSSGSTPGDDSSTSCTAAKCKVNSDCDTACGSVPGVNCCGNGACFPSMSSTCDTEAGSGDDGGGTPPAPSM